MTTSAANLSLLLPQWQSSPKLKAVIEIWLRVVREEFEQAIADLRRMANLETAEGIFLDYIGRRVGLSRPFVPDPAGTAGVRV